MKLGPWRFSKYVNQRREVGKLADRDPLKALEVARRISDSWYRCQALAEVACHLEDPRLLKKVIGEALEAAYEQKEPNRIVTVASWPVYAMVQRGDRRRAAVVDELLQKIQTEPNPVRQAHALVLLFQAVYSEPQLRPVVLEPLLRACEEMNSWRRPIILSELALVLAVDDPTRAEQVIDMIGEGQKSRQTRRYMAFNHRLGPRRF